MTITCDWCGRRLQPDQATAYWPQGQRDQARYVCRPSPNEGKALVECFRAVVQGASTHAIGPATHVVRP